ncbi:MAG: thioesterase domain-containing protein [Bryobacteraceae bacterium]
MGVSLAKYRHLNFMEERNRIAGEVADLLMRTQGTGPFLLGGRCADGLTAHETAKAIQARGGVVDLVVLFDTVNLDYYREARALVHSASRTFASVKAVMNSAVHNGLSSSASNLTQAFGEIDKRAGKRVKEVWTSDYSVPPPSFPLAVMRPIAAALEQADLGWGDRSSSPVSVVEVPGTHDTMFKAPHVDHQQYVRTHAAIGAAPQPSAGRWPVVFFSPSAGGYRSQNTFVVESLVSHGYAVVTFDHPDTSSRVVFGDGSVMHSLPDVWLNLSSERNWKASVPKTESILTMNVSGYAVRV